MSLSVKLIGTLAVSGAAGIALGLARSRYERDCLVVEETEIVSRKIKKPRTMVFLTDLHDKEFGNGNERLFKVIRDIGPDFVLIGGDTMVAKAGTAKLDVTERLLDGLCRSLGEGGGRNPDREENCASRIYYGNGNHEQRIRDDRETYGNLYGEFLELLEARHICYLSDRTAQVGEDISISGLDIGQIYYRDLIPAKMKAEYLRRRLGKADGERFQILMAHSPLFFDAYADWGADLALAGHFHGGTIRIPGLGGVMTPQYQFFLPLCAGTFRQNDRCMIVGRGLGTHSINIRIFNKPQVVVVKLKPGTI